MVGTIELFLLHHPWPHPVDLHHYLLRCRPLLYLLPLLLLSTCRLLAQQYLFHLWHQRWVVPGSQHIWRQFWLLSSLCDWLSSVLHGPPYDKNMSVTTKNN